MTEKKKIVVDHFFYKDAIIPIEEWHYDWDVCPIQRDHEERAKRPKHKKKFSALESSHLEVYGAILTKDCICSETKKEYKKGTKFKTDGHTRDEYWWSDYSTLQGLPEKVRVKYKEFDNMSDIYKEYLHHDNPDDAEIASDRVDGAYRDVFAHRGIEITNGKLRKVEPIQYAAKYCFPLKYGERMKTTTTNIRLWVSDLEEAILWLRNVYADKEFAKEKCDLKHMNPFTLVYLMSYMKYRKDSQSLDKLKEFIINVSNELWDPTMLDNGKCTIEYHKPLNRFMKEWKLLSTGTSPYVFAAMNDTDQANNCRSFCLYMIDCYVLDQPISKTGNIPPDWKNYKNKWQVAYNLENNQVEQQRKDIFDLAENNSDVDFTDLLEMDSE
jgi:hypothetical protein